jgi:tRNA (guanine-N7-)-methyltransferase
VQDGLQKNDHPKIRSFILRQGRSTAGQKLAMENHWDEFCLDLGKSYNYSRIFGREAPLILEIGFGNGGSLAEMAYANPEINYLGIEVHRPGVGHLMYLLKQKNIKNVRIYHHDAIEVLEQKIADNSLSAVHLFFPDPWQKRRHHKRRIVRPDFVDLLNKKLKQGGYFHAATDWEHYAKEMLATLSSSDALINSSVDDRFSQRPEHRPVTKFENRGLRLGHGVWDLIFEKC